MKLLNIKNIFPIIVVLCFGLTSSQTTLAANCASTGTISASCTSLGWSSGNLTIDSPAVIAYGSGPWLVPINIQTNVGSLINNSIIDGSVNGAYAAILLNIGSVTAITNTISGQILGANGVSSADGIYVNSDTQLNTLINAGVISGSNNAGVFINSAGVISTISNTGSISGGLYGIYNSGGTIASITNTGSGSISGAGGEAILNNGTIGSITNAGSISGSGGLYGGIYNGDTIGTITNYGAGVISGSSGGPSIINAGTINTLNVGGSSTLTYNGPMPGYLNLIVNGSSSGKFSLIGIGNTGQSTFGIYGGGVSGVAASTLNKGTYSSVLSGVTSSNLNGATSGNYNGFTWRLNNSSGSIWDLIVTGASTADTQQSLVNTASALQNTFTLQNTVLANSFSYDCNVFGANNVCVSAGGRNTAVSAANGLNNTSALLIAAYRVMPSVRVGAYADQNLSVSNAGSTVNLGNNTPLIGLFGAWNERLDGTGTEVKVSAAYGQKNTTVTRSVVGTSEAGSGSSQLNSQGAQVTAKYGFGFTPDVIVSPYVGMRYTQNNMGGYTEATTSSVTAPLTYSALNTNATTALAGVGAQYKFIPQATVFASAGVETDTNTSNGTYSATGVTGLTPINFNANPVKTRPTATVGAYYDVEKNQRLGVTGIYRQEPYQAVQTTTVMATYTVGL